MFIGYVYDKTVAHSLGLFAAIQVVTIHLNASQEFYLPDLAHDNSISGSFISIIPESYRMIIRYDSGMIG